MKLINTAPCFNAAEFLTSTRCRYENDLHQMCSGSTPPFSCNTIITICAWIRKKKMCLQKTAGMKRLINICSFAFVQHSLPQNYPKLTEFVVNIINNKAEFRMKRKYLITEMRRLHLLHFSSPLWLRMGHKPRPNEEALFEFQAHILNQLLLAFRDFSFF